MREINFHEVGFENFCSYTDLTIFEFKNGTITLIIGPNGSGKSTVFNAINFALYGITSTGLRGEEVVNNRVGKNCMVYSSFSIQDDNYVVKRYVKHHKEGDSVYLYKNDTLIKKGHREVVPEIESIILPQKLFTNTLFFGQRVKTFFTDLTDSEQKDIFRKVLQLDNYNEYYDFVSNELKSLNKDLSSIENETNVVNGLLEECRLQIVEIKRDKGEFEQKKIDDKLQAELRLKVLEASDILSVEDENEDLDHQLSSTITTLNEAKIEYENIKNQKELQISDINSKKKAKEAETREKYLTEKSDLKKLYDSEIITLNSSKDQEILSYEKKESELKLKINVVEKDLLELKNKMTILDEEIKSIEKHLNTDSPICYACKQKIGEKEKKELSTILSNKKKELEIINTKIKTESENLETLKIEFGNIKKSLEEIRLEIKTIKDNLSKKYDNSINELNKKFNSFIEKLNEMLNKKLLDIENTFATTLKNSLDKINEYQTSVNEIRSKIELRKKSKDLKQEVLLKISKVKAEIEEIEKREFNESFIVNLINKENELKNKLDTLITKRKDMEMRINIYDFWKTGFSMSGIPSMLIDEAIPFMNNRITYYLDQIGSRYLVSFDTINETKSGEYRDKIKINILDTVTKANSRKQLSGGQTRIIDIATIFTLRDLQSKVQDMKINIILLDEIFDSLDETNIAYVSSMLRQMINDQSINIISHRNIDQIESDTIYRTI